MTALTRSRASLMVTASLSKGPPFLPSGVPGLAQCSLWSQCLSVSTFREAKGTIGVSLVVKVPPGSGKEDQDWDWEDRTPLYSQAMGVPPCGALVCLLAEVPVWIRLQPRRCSCLSVLLGGSGRPSHPDVRPSRLLWQWAVAGMRTRAVSAVLAVSLRTLEAELSSDSSERPSLGWRRWGGARGRRLPGGLCRVSVLSAATCRATASSRTPRAAVTPLLGWRAVGGVSLLGHVLPTVFCL